LNHEGLLLKLLVFNGFSGDELKASKFAVVGFRSDSPIFEVFVECSCNPIVTSCPEFPFFVRPLCCDYVQCDLSASKAFPSDVGRFEMHMSNNWASKLLLLPEVPIATSSWHVQVLQYTSPCTTDPAESLGAMKAIGELGPAIWLGKDPPKRRAPYRIDPSSVHGQALLALKSCQPAQQVHHDFARDHEACGGDQPPNDDEVGTLHCIDDASADLNELQVLESASRQAQATLFLGDAIPFDEEEEPMEFAPSVSSYRPSTSAPPSSTPGVSSSSSGPSTGSSSSSSRVFPDEIHVASGLLVWRSRADFDAQGVAGLLGRLHFFGSCTIRATCKVHPGCTHLVSYRDITVAQAEGAVKRWLLLAVCRGVDKSRHQALRTKEADWPGMFSAG